jgi:hypothetical protein
MTYKVYDDDIFKGERTGSKKLENYLFDDTASVPDNSPSPTGVIPGGVILPNPAYYDYKIPNTTTTTTTAPVITPTEKKDTNPKDAVGIKKVAFSTVPQTVIAEVAVGMTEGARKYGRHNWRAAEARASVYFDATLRHLYKWYEGEDIDPDSGLSHITKAITSLVVLRDAMINDKWNDDRPPKIPEGFWEDIQAKVDEVFAKYPDCVPPITEGGSI